uniref:protein-tyrosine-phosphatase n=1 Tax=Magallana gigas TaxID=29159 RepID=A0A8W8MLF1_MAGGI
MPSCSELPPEAKPITAIISGSVGGILVFAGIVIVVIIVLRKRPGKKAESKYYENGALSLDNIDNQYSEVNINRSKRKKAPETPKQDEASNEQTTTYYNLNNTDVIKAQKARQEVYYEFSPVYRPSKTAVPVSEFKYFVDCKKRNNEFFAEQFKKFYTGLQFPATAAVAPGNRAKNKYKNIYPYDETRVLLKKEKDYSESDFINASIIHGFGSVKSYIAAQGPLINTIDDFWWMVWNEECSKIVMLTNLIEDDKVKCIQYWPDDDAMDTRNMKLELVDSESFADFTIRTLKLTNGAEHRTIRQFHFTAWPDKRVPMYASSLVHFHSKVIHTETNLKGPMIVHCSAGIGRTGTFIALNYLVQQAKESGYVDVFECVNTLRRQRLNMVQTLEQYKFLHDATIEALMCTSSDPSSAEFPQIYEDLLKVDAETGKRNIDLNFENLGIPSSSLPESVYSLAKSSINRRKNRYSNILPVDSEMPQIRDEENNPIYINAVFLPAYKTKRAFIATQMPLKDTVIDFWRLLYEQQVSTIVMLNQLDSNKPKEYIGKYWPEDLNAIAEFGPFRITKKGFTEGTDFYIIDLCCHKEGQNENNRKIRLFQGQFWPDSSTVPTSVLSFLKLINDVELHHDRNNSGPVVVHCMNGAEKSGLFCVMQVVLERMKIEQDVAIHHVIQQMRSIRPSIIPNADMLQADIFVFAITCQAPFFADNLHISTDKQIYNYSEAIRFSCSDGFFLQGISERTCKRNGTLQPPFPNCTDITCQRPILSIRGSLQLSTNPLQQTFSYNESISFFCITGYILHGPTVKYCRTNGDFERGLPRCTAQGKQESPSFTVGFFSGGAVGIVVTSSVIIVILFLRRRLCQQKKNENAWYNGGNHQIDDDGHEYSGIEYQSSDRENHNPNVKEPSVSVSDGHYTETKFDSDDKDHQYTKLNEIKMNQLTEATADRPVQL